MFDIGPKRVGLTIGNYGIGAAVRELDDDTAGRHDIGVVAAEADEGVVAAAAVQSVVAAAPGDAVRKHVAGAGEAGVSLIGEILDVGGKSVTGV